MSDIQIMSLAMQKAEWLSARQSILAQNIANSNTPGYRSKDLMPFEAVLQSTGLTMASTSAKHMLPAGTESGAAIVAAPGSGDLTYNRNNVSLEGEMSKLGETTSQYALSTSIIKSFHKMIMMSVKV